MLDFGLYINTQMSALVKKRNKDDQNTILYVDKWSVKYKGHGYREVNILQLIKFANSTSALEWRSLYSTNVIFKFGEQSTRNLLMLLKYKKSIYQ